MKLRKIFLLLILTLLFLGLSYATELSNDTTNTMDTSIADTNNEVVQSSNTPIKEVENIITDKNTKEITRQYNDTAKTASSKTYTVNDFDTLYNALTSDTYSTVTLNIKSNIKLTSNTNLNKAIKTLNINGNGKTIDGDSCYQFLLIGDSKVTIKNIKITHCFEYNGGAILNYGTLIINNSTLNNNNAEYDGGAIYNQGTLTITNTILQNNTASHDAGAIYNKYGNLTIKNSSLNKNNAYNRAGAIINFGYLTINNTTINNNSGNGGDWDNCGGAIRNYGTVTINNSILNYNKASYDGGAIYNWYSGNLTINNSTINNNSAMNTGGAIRNCGNITINNSTIINNIAEYNGGAIFNGHDYGGYQSKLILNNCILNNNTSKYGDGGAVYNWPNVNLTINNSTLNNNNAESYGGAIYNKGTLNITKTTLNNNKAYGGGAIYNTWGTITLTNNILNNNRANYGGGAIYSYEGTITLTNTTLKNNKADGTYSYGGAIYNDGKLTITNSVFEENNTSRVGGAIFNYRTLIIKNCTLNNNKAEGTYSYGGAIYNSGINNLTNIILNNNIACEGGAIYNVGKLTITNTTLNNNLANYYGGAIYNRYDFMITKTILQNNIANYYGGAIYNQGKLNIKASVLTNNIAIRGAAIYDEGFDVLIEKNKFKANNAEKGMKAIDYTGTVEIKDNINDEISNDHGTIYTQGLNVKILKNTFDIGRYPTWIKIASMSNVNYGSTVKLVARLLYNGTTALKYKQVNVTVNDKTYQVKSDGAGYIRLNYTVNNYNTQKITFKYVGSSMYLACTNSTSFKVKQFTWIKIASMSNVNYGSTVKVVARLLYNGTTALKYKQVNVTVNDKTYQVKSDGAGYIRLNYMVNNYDDQKISFKYAGSSLYQASSNSTTFKVKQPTWIKHAVIGKVKKGSTVKIVGRLLYNGTTSVKYVNVNVTLNDKVYNLKTDGAGYYRLNYTATTTGTVTFTSNFGGNKLYLASTNSTTFTVVKS